MKFDALRLMAAIALLTLAGCGQQLPASQSVVETPQPAQMQEPVLVSELVPKKESVQEEVPAPQKKLAPVQESAQSAVDRALAQFEPLQAAVEPAVAKPVVAAPVIAQVSLVEPKQVAAVEPNVVEEQTAKQKGDPGEKFFKKPVVHELRVDISPPELQLLRNNNRAYVRADLKEGPDKVYNSVGVKLKGAAGSFRGVDDRPALTLNMDKYAKKQDFHSLDKFHLNNSVQDGSYLNEAVCYEICRQAGVPAARATHAHVWLNNRDLGLYVVKEGFDRKFLKLHFEHTEGNLYDGGFLRDIDQDLEKDSGEGVNDRSDLKALRAACQEPDINKRWTRIAEVLDIDAFLSFVAVEFITCHWDGYANNKNNYRIYFEPKSGKAYFFPHGMDQMFGDTGFNLMHQPGTIVAGTVLQNPVWRRKYRKRLRELMPIFDPPTKLTDRVDEIAAHIKPYFEAKGADHARGFMDQVRGVKDRLVARSNNMKQQLAQPDPDPLDFEDTNPLLVADWAAQSERGDVKAEQVDIGDGKKAYAITAGPGGQAVASWRRKLKLHNGRYRFEVKAKAEGLEPLPEGDKGVGAGVRLGGGQRQNKLVGSTDWTVLTHEFDVPDAQREVDLVMEMRALKGRVLFDSQSLKLHLVK